jgi:hypothetical protein
MAPFYTPFVVRAFFEENEVINFFNLACALHYFKLYMLSCSDKTKINCISLDDFKGKIFS